MTSSTVSSMLFLLLFVFLLHIDEALGAQTEIRKLKGTIKMRRNLESNDHRSSKMLMEPSITRRCQGPKSFKNMATSTYGPVGGYSSSLCQTCLPLSPFCYTIRCVITRDCQEFQGQPEMCTPSESCTRISGH